MVRSAAAIEDGPVQAIKPGDTMSIAPGIALWHGASNARGMTHVAIAEAQDGKSVTRLEPVSDAGHDGSR